MSNSPERFALRARWLFPVEGPPLANGVVTIQGDRIASVGREAPACHVDDLGNAAILPGLVNAHTHLEYSDLAKPWGQPGMTFPDWIRLVVAHKRSVGPPRRSVIEQGLAECTRSGVTTLGEIASPGWPAEAFEQAPLDTTVFLELIGLAASRTGEQLARAREHFERAEEARTAQGESIRWRPGLSPHAPYTVHPRLLAGALEMASRAGAPVAVHLAESLDELKLLGAGTRRRIALRDAAGQSLGELRLGPDGGPLPGLLEGLGAWDPSAIPIGTRPLDYLRPLSRHTRSLVIHGNYLDDEEIALAAASRDALSLVYCPRTHAWFGHAPYPLLKLLAAGANVALGTDSRASNPDLSLLDEMRLVAWNYSLPGDQVLRLGTINGARALGREQEVGSLVPGKYADLAILPLPPHDVDDPHNLLFDSTLPVAATIYRGQVAYRSQGQPLP